MEECKSFLESNMKYKVKQLQVSEDQNKEVMKLLLDSIRNVEVLNLDCSSNCQDWLTIDIFTKWKLTKLSMNELRIPLIMNIIQKKNELIYIELLDCQIDDTIIITIAQYCPKLEKLVLNSKNLTYTSLIALSERGLPLKELVILNYMSILNIPTAALAAQCAHSLSRIYTLTTNDTFPHIDYYKY